MKELIRQRKLYNSMRRRYNRKVGRILPLYKPERHAWLITAMCEVITKYQCVRTQQRIRDHR